MAQTQMKDMLKHGKRLYILGSDSACMAHLNNVPPLARI